MKRVLCLFTGLLSLFFVFFVTPQVFTSDFDKFAKATIKEFGHSSDPQLVTDAVLQYLDDNQIDDPIAFFMENMDITFVIDADDPNLQEHQKKIFASGEVTRSTSFRSKYFNRVVTNYELTVRIRDFRSGERSIHARIYLNAP
jgi:hypothetical protein